MQRSCISFPIHFPECTLRIGHDIIWRDDERTIELGFSFSVTPEHSVTISGLAEPPKVARVELNCPFEGSYGFFPASLTPLNGTHQREYPGIIWQAPACNFELSQSAIVVEVSAIKVVCSCEVRFAGI